MKKALKAWIENDTVRCMSELCSEFNCPRFDTCKNYFVDINPSMNLELHEKLYEAEDYIRKQNNHIDYLENGVKEIMSFIENETGTVDHPRKLTMEGVLKIYQDLRKLADSK